MGKYDQKKVPAPEDGARVSRGNSPVSDNPELEAVARWLSSVKFKKKALGGLDPVDVWKKLEEMNALYENALVAERVRYNLLLRQLSRQQSSEESDG